MAAVRGGGEEACKLPSTLEGIRDLPVREVFADPLDLGGGADRAFVQGQQEVAGEEVVDTSLGGGREDVRVLGGEQKVS